MGDREKAKQTVGRLPEEIEDNLLCEKIYQEYLDDPDPEKDIEYPLDECKKEWGLM